MRLFLFAIRRIQGLSYRYCGLGYATVAGFAMGVAKVVGWLELEHPFVCQLVL